MKKIMLAKKGKRILARFIDLSIVFLLTVFIFLIGIYPNTFDQDKFISNNEEIIELYDDSGLFVVDAEGNYNAKCAFNNIMTLEDLYSMDVSYGGVVYEDLSLTETLYTYYTTKFNQYGGLNNLTYESYCSNILKVGTAESNIASFDASTYTFTLINNDTPDVTIIYFIEKYQNACTTLISDSKIQTLTEENQELMLNSIKLIIPLLIGILLIFDFIIPVCSKESQTVGKHLLKLALISNDGYHYKKSKHVIRFIVYVAEIILGIVTMGGVLLITYTMFMFKKNRRCLHDVIAGSVVIDAKESFFFKNQKEEVYYEERAKRKGIFYE